MSNLWIFALTICALIFSSVTALRCNSCDGLCNCLKPSTTECGFQTQCYTVKRLSDGKVTRKGCTADCNMVNDFDGMCTLCRGPYCNTESSLTPMSGAYDECKDELGQPGLGQNINQPIGLGQRQGFDQGLGQGQNFGQNQGLGQGLGSQEIRHGGLGQGIGQQPGLGSQGINQPGGLGQGQNILGPSPNQLNYQPAPSIGNNQLGQGFNDGNQLGQGYNGLGQGFRNSAVRNGFNLLAIGAAFFGLNRM